MKTKNICGKPCYEIKTANVDFAVTRESGHIAPVTFRCGGKTIQPFSIEPWSQRKDMPKGVERILKNIRGDFFCLPFGGNTTPIKKLGYGKKYLYECHGEPANADWDFEASAIDARGGELHLSLKSQRGPKYRVDKRLYARTGQTVLYEEDTVSGLNAEMPVGHHPTLDFTGKSARLSAGKFLFGQVNPTPFEDPACGGYSCLKPGAIFKSLKKVPTVFGTTADLSVYPARAGYEDLVLMFNDRSRPFAWQAAVVQKEGWVYFALKDPKQLAASIFWISNGGRHYEPWNGKHTCRLGIEDATSFFAYGWAESRAKNFLNKKKIPTTLRFSSKKPTSIRYILGVARVPKTFDEVADIRRVDKDTVVLIAKSGARVKANVHLDFLRNGAKAWA